ncbi:UNVERIFIED_CONTAM: hypothetical protein Scaly_2643800 [Sesamum calycinum]|uniref:RNase H type-1 domain-containing protein n=1 Tax=Sesamum calycinum TaxID=2727403 RepID=A0AAW2JA76_9LAMI
MSHPPSTESLKSLTLPLTQINMKQPSKPPLKGFSTQEEEGGHEALAIDEKGFDPKAFKLLIKTGYDPKEKLNLGKLPPEATGKKLHLLNATQIMLKEKGHAIQDSRVGLGFTPPKPVRITIKRVNSNYISEGFSSTEDHKREKFERIRIQQTWPHRKELHGIANRQSVFDRLGPCKKVRHQKKKVAVCPNKNIKSSHTQKLRSLIPSRMKRQTTLTISCGRVLKAKAQTVIFTQVQSDDEDDKENGEVEEEDAEDAPAELEEGIKATIDELKEVNLGDIENPRPIYISASLTHGEERTYVALLHEFKDVFAWSYKEMPGLDPKHRSGKKEEWANSSHEALSFMDGSSGYNQIRMAPADEELTAFRTPKGRPLILYVAAQERSVGILLAQKNDEGKENALYYLSRTMTPNELNIHLLKSCANPLKYVMAKPVLSDRLARWYLQLQQFEITYVPQKAVKGQVLADFLADHPMPAEWELSDDLPDEDVLVIEVTPPWKMYFDGASHKEGAGAGVVFVTSEGEVLPYSFTLTQNCSNNVAEYQALILGLEIAVDAKQLPSKVYGDSQLVVNQLLGLYEVKKLLPYHNYAKD